LPQYNIAVAKAKFSQFTVIANAIVQAEQIEFMQNGKYTNDLKALSTELPNGGTYNADNSGYNFGNFGLLVSLTDDSGTHNCVCIFSNKIPVTHCHYFDRKRRDCRAAIGNSAAAKVCQSLGAKYNHSDAAHDMYYFD
jgi:hypothetical protein